MARKQTSSSRTERLGFRVDRQTRALIKRAAELEQRKVTEFCVTALAEAARQTIAQHETIVLSERDRQVFFETLVNPPKISRRLEQAFKAERHRVKPQ